VWIASIQSSYLNKDDNEVMSAQNGDKARYGRLRKKKIARRVKMRDLKKTLLEALPPIVTTP